MGICKDMNQKAGFVRVCAGHADELRGVGEFLRGGWCDIDGLRFDGHAEVLELPFEQDIWAERDRVKKWWVLSKWTCPTKKCFLRIRHVESYELNDEAHIGRVELGAIEYDEHTGLVRIESYFPVVITVKVRRLEVEVEQTGTVIRNKHVLLLNWVARER